MNPWFCHVGRFRSIPAIRSFLPLVLAGSALILAMSEGQAVADGLVRKLPADGSWATFHCMEEFDDGNKRAYYVTIKSVGAVEVEKKACRWLEFKFQDDEQRKSGIGLAEKFLIPDEHWGPKGDPSNHAIKAWRKRVDKEPMEFAKLEDYFPRLYLILPPPIDLKKTKVQEAVEWQGGRLMCDVLQGTARHVLKVETCETQFRLLVSDKAPFGVAGASQQIQSNRGYKGTVEYRLTDMGTGAICDMPGVR